MNLNKIANMDMNRIISWQQIIFVSTLVLLAIWHLWSLQYSPMPWYDEIVFASINHNILLGNGMVNEVEGNFPDYTYGPVYFIFTAIATKLLGYSIFSFRLVNLCFAFLSVGITYLILRRLKVSKSVSQLSVFLLAMDVLFIQNAHSGRMECVALFFALMGYFFVIRNDEFKISMMGSLIISTCLIFSFLTTPRVVVILLPVAIYELWHLFKVRKWLNLFVYIFTAFFIYSVWVYCSYGSFQEMIRFYTLSGTTNIPNESLINTFIGGNFNIAIYHYPLIVSLVISLFISLKKRTLRTFSFLFFSPIVLFYLLVFETGQYATMVIPFFCIIIAMGFNQIGNGCGKLNSFFLKIFVYSCFLINFGIFFIKSIAIISCINTRNPRLVDLWISSVVVQDKRVTGSDIYYYSLKKNRNDFRYLETIEIDDSLKCFQGDYQPEYIIIASEEKESRWQTKLSRLKMTKISEYNPKVQRNVFVDFLDNIFYMRKSYNGTIYRIDGVK